MRKTTEKMWLAKMSLDWADEADFTYYEIISDSDKQKYEEYLSKYKDITVNKYFGTNEDSDFTGEEIDGSIEWFEIPSNEVLKFIEDAVVDYGGGEISGLICRRAGDGGEDIDYDEFDSCDCDDCEECDDEDEED